MGVHVSAHTNLDAREWANSEKDNFESLHKIILPAL